MILKTYYWCFRGAVSPSACDKIIKQSRTTPLSSGKVGEKEAVEKKDRTSKVRFINDDSLFSLIGDFIRQANKNANWNFQWDWIEPVQFTSYSKKGFYGWHADGFDEPLKKPNPNFNGKIRKLSFILQLTDPKKYTGGELRFSFPGVNKNIHKPKNFLPQGSIIIFPSFVQHEITPIKTGKRYSLVAWCLGKPWL